MHRYVSSGLTSSESEGIGVAAAVTSPALVGITAGVAGTGNLDGVDAPNGVSARLKEAWGRGVEESRRFAGLEGSCVAFARWASSYSVRSKAYCACCGILHYKIGFL